MCETRCEPFRTAKVLLFFEITKFFAIKIALWLIFLEKSESKALFLIIFTSKKNA